MRLAPEMRRLKYFFPARVAIFTMSILITLMFWAIIPNVFRENETSDYSRHYEPAARNMLAGRGLTTADGSLASRYPPGYPLILAAVFGLSALLSLPEDSLVAALILCCMGLASVVLFLIARTIWRPLPAFVASAIWMTYPFGLWLAKQPNSELPFLAVLWGSLYVFWCALLNNQRGWLPYFVAGLLAGFAMLIRPIAIGLGLLMVSILWFVGRKLAWRVRLLSAAMLLVGNLLTILPWQVWLYANTTSIAPLSTGGAVSIRDGLTFGVQLKDYRKGIAIPDDVEVLMWEISKRSSEMQSLGNILGVLVEETQSRPAAVVKLFVIKAARSWYGTNSQRFETQTIGVQAVYLVLLMWGGIAAWRQGGPARQLAVTISLTLLYFWGMTILVLPIMRYMVPPIGLSFALVPALFAWDRKTR